MYFVDRDLIEKRLKVLEKQLELFSAHEWDHEINKLALERIAHMTIEIIIDVGNQMIDGFIMRDPGSYEDVVDILVDERVISENDGLSLKRIIPWRKVLLQDYISIDHDKLAESLRNESEILLKYSGKIRLYLKSELGPVSAFLPTKE
ncbi:MULTISPECIES: DUF86 domain-containing protein [Bacillaceae]|uniref:DUF86 domain-containing protein n=1 Tax=Evansella alkalicola TaxID=745819 RepID=A0ABS6JU85_9BACI|nr:MULTISPECIES: DUF86 domain-containing protein [Bacillaceae]MBU9722134.1 DUF86 domain-containing protein [Bacillus alkalicola]